MIRGALVFVLFVAGLIGGFLGIGSFLPPERVPIVTPKLENFAENAAEYDTLFLGSSRTYRQVDTKLFDQITAAAGHPTRSYNLAVDGMRPPEDDFLLDRALAMLPKGHRLKAAFVECNPIRHQLDEDTAGTTRSLYWHDAERMVWLWKRSFRGSSKRARWSDHWEALPNFAGHTAQWLQRMMNVGRGSEFLLDAMDVRPLTKLVAQEAGVQGYRPAPDHAFVGKDREQYDKDVAERLVKPARRETQDPVSQAILTSKRDHLTALGAKLWFIGPPIPNSRIFIPDEKLKVPFLDFSDPVKYPALFDPKHRMDPGHLNVAGAEIYTRAIAEAYLKQFDKPAAR